MDINVVDYLNDVRDGTTNELTKQAQNEPLEISIANRRYKKTITINRKLRR